jgi:hypothetical protein
MIWADINPRMALDATNSLVLDWCKNELEHNNELGSDKCKNDLGDVA